MSSHFDRTQPSSSRGVIVLGMHRSGTSVLSRALIALNVDFGNSLVDAKEDNPKGFFEDKDVNALNVEFLRTLGCDWHSLVLPSSYPAKVVEAFELRVATLLQEKFARCPLWGLKDPRITRLLQIWSPAILEANVQNVYVLANRNPFSVADSLTNRDDMPRAQALALWALHQIDGLQAVINNGGLIVDYDLMMQQPSAELRRIAHFIGQEVEADRQQIFVHNFLEQGLRHSYYADESRKMTSSPLDNACLSFHHNLLKLAKIPGPLSRTELDAAKAMVRETQHSISLNSDWFYAVDSIYRKVGDVKRALQEKERTIRSLETDLASVNANRFVRIVNRLKEIV